MLEWLRDLLLESPVPPARWMPTREERLADARQTLRRRFGEQAEEQHPPSHQLVDLTLSAHPFPSAVRYVPGESIEADLEADITSVNPPILQGWALALLVVVCIEVFFGLAAFARPSSVDVPTVLLELLGAPLIWLGVVLLWAAVQQTIELTERGVRTRRWVEIWTRRRGRQLGQPGLLHASLHRPFDLRIDGPEGSVSVSVRTWRASARADLIDELPLWGIDCDFGRHRHHHERGRTRRRK